MLGLDLNSWNNLMVAFLGIGACAAVIVGVSTYAVIQLQKTEAKDASDAFNRYKIETGEKISAADERAELAKEHSAKLELQVAEAKTLAGPRNIRGQDKDSVGVVSRYFIRP